MTAAVIAFLGIGLFIWQFGKDAVIADLVRAAGPIQWTGNNGLVERQIVAGKTLTGGTLELLAPDASATVDDLELPLADFRSGAPTVSASPAGQHLVGWHCLTGDREADLTINAVRLSGPM